MFRPNAAQTRCAVYALHSWSDPADRLAHKRSKIGVCAIVTANIANFCATATDSVTTGAPASGRFAPAESTVSLDTKSLQTFRADKPPRNCDINHAGSVHNAQMT
ncbi:hypothetical protein BBBOND_0304340 [Babesia bigemina]|uniref:Uncharacterized protein n=1 Tax=Babesia bigemina TaxID=5866 RepID=A0A061DDS6_BABBI|nr:hypothetical protein BBBOND_0304340 [Babesia bigemina]CDR96530.1 hypothetical protein BBBOND_0304340 [Babesia bigemina]|eukprot:XP_012768716.1 hypothetical protein BBBOND_0304340 [Babesia bigemina]